MREKSLYFVAIVPQGDLQQQVTAIKEYFAEEHNSKQGLKSPPHITLYMPFRWREDREDRLISQLQNFAVGQNEFEIEFRNFGSFKPRVIFIDVEHNDNLVAMQSALQKFAKLKLKLFDPGKRAGEINPHMTVAFRDLRKSEYFKAWEKFQHEKFAATFWCDAITLLKHNGKTWDILKTIDFS